MDGVFEYPADVAIAMGEEKRQLRKRVAELEQEWNRYKTALEQIATGRLTTSGDLQGADYLELRIVQIARQALARE